MWKFFSIKFVIAANFVQEVLLVACCQMGLIKSAKPEEYTDTAVAHALVSIHRQWFSCFCWLLALQLW